jgi:hypothetical protein
MNPARRHRRGLALLAALAVTINVLAGALHAPPLAAGVIVDDVLGPLTICNSAASDPASPAHDAPANNADHRSDCPLCLRSAALLLSHTPEIGPPVFVVPAVLGPVYERPPALAGHLSRGGIRSRAPPPDA